MHAVICVLSCFVYRNEIQLKSAEERLEQANSEAQSQNADLLAQRQCLETELQLQRSEAVATQVRGVVTGGITSPPSLFM